MSSAGAASQPRSPAGRRLQIQRLSASSTRPLPITATALAPAWRPSTQISQTTVRYSGKAMSCLKPSIHAPGLGIQRAAPGTRPMIRNGAARPRPRVAKTSSAVAVFWVIA